SASSKVACGIAFSLAADGKRDRRKVVGITSERNVAFVNGTGLFERVITYPEVTTLPTRRTVYVDIAGSSTLRAAIHQHFGSALRYSIVVGATHQDRQSSPPDLPGPEPVPFFPPTWIRHRHLQWTPDVVRRRLGDAWRSFLVPILDPSRSWMTIAS